MALNWLIIFVFLQFGNPGKDCDVAGNLLHLRAAVLRSFGHHPALHSEKVGSNYCPLKAVLRIRFISTERL